MRSPEGCRVCGATSGLRESSDGSLICTSVLQCDKNRASHFPAEDANDHTCAREVCRAENANWWNTSTRRYYCTSCAAKINRFSPDLCVLMGDFRDERAFHEKRTMFIIFDRLPVFAATGDPRSHKEWCATLGEPMADLINGPFARGYVLDRKVVFYQGSDYGPVDQLLVAGALGVMWALRRVELIDQVWNGVLQGPPGGQWPPLKILGLVRDVIRSGPWQQV